MEKLDKAIKDLKKQYDTGVIMDLRKKDPLPKVERVPVSSPKIGELLGGGGSPRGRVIVIYGPESGGKCIAFETSLTINIDDEFYQFLVKRGFINGI